MLFIVRLLCYQGGGVVKKRALAPSLGSTRMQLTAAPIYTSHLSVSSPLLVCLLQLQPLLPTDSPPLNNTSTPPIPSPPPHLHNPPQIPPKCLKQPPPLPSSWTCSALRVRLSLSPELPAPRAWVSRPLAVLPRWAPMWPSPTLPARRAPRRTLRSSPRSTASRPRPTSATLASSQSVRSWWPM